MASKARFSRWVGMSAGTSAAVLGLALSFAAARADDAATTAPAAEIAETPGILDDFLPLERPLTFAAEAVAPPSTTPAASPIEAAEAPAALRGAVAIDIPPPDLPPVEVSVEPAVPATEVAPPTLAEQAAPAAAGPAHQAEIKPGEAVPTKVPPAEVAPAAPVAAEVTLPEWPPEVPAPVIVADKPADPLLPVAAALKDLLASAVPARQTTALVSRRERDMILRFYEGRDFRPVFVDGAGATPAGRGVARQVATAELDGLDPSSYPMPLQAGPGPAQLADVELGMALAAFAYARDARGGRLDPTRLSALITPDLDLPSPEEVLGALVASTDTASVLAAYQPRHAGYLALKEKLAELRESTGAVSRQPLVGDGPALRVGMRDPRVPALRARLGLPVAADDVFDADLSAALAAWQKQQGLRPTGRLDRGMASALDGRTATGIGAADIVANMERWRWLPRDLGARHIEVNLPEYTLRVLQDDKVIHQTRVVIGKPQTATPIFSNRVQYVVVNPYWNIPPSIMKKEILPKLAEDPNYAAAHGYEVIRRGNSIAVRQPPGERNALGFIKFLFPNQHSVYLHDTPSRSLFAQDKRAFSHGCVRVEQPFRLGEVVLGGEGYDEERLRRMIGKGERTIRLKEPLAIHLTYFTLFVDENGRLQRRDDLYGYDGRVKTALGISANGLKYAGLR